MTLDRAFQIASRLLASAGLSALILSDELGFPFGFAGSLALILSMIMAVRGSRLNFGRLTWTFLNLTTIVFFILDLLFVSQDLLIASTHFIVFLMINKLFNLRTPQDHFQLYLISFLQLLAASTFTIEITFFVSFVLYLLAATWALLLLHLVIEQNQISTTSGSQPAAARSPGLTWPFFFSTNSVALGGLGFTLILFILLPRIGLGYFHHARSNLIRLSGFSEQVNLGEIGTVKLDSTVVMRIQPDRPLPSREGIYWRGMVFDHYDGRSWRNSLGSGVLLSKARGGGGFTVPVSGYPGRTIYQEIILEPLDTKVLFGASFPIHVNGRFANVKVNSMGALSLTNVPATRIDYTVSSRIPMLTRQDANSRLMSYSPMIRKTYLQLPEGSDRIRGLAEDILRGAGHPETVLQKILAIENYLEANYRYTLDVQSAPSGNPIEDFLFSQKAGFCEHYATSMILLLRSIGIPARLVTGFLPGEWNEFGKYYTVRQRNAHAWVEVWFARSGWYPFDPTPSDPNAGAPSFLGLFARSIDVLQWQWNRYVIYYSLGDQIGLARGVKSDTIKLRDWIAAQIIAMLNWAKWVLASILSHPMVAVLAGVVVSGMVFAILRRHRWRLGWFRIGRWPLWKGSRGFKKVHRVKFYFLMLELFQANGQAKRANLTPREFVTQLPETLGPAMTGSAVTGGSGRDSSVRSLSPKAIASQLTDLYYCVRFGGIPLSASEDQHAAGLLSDLETALNPP